MIQPYLIWNTLGSIVSCLQLLQRVIESTIYCIGVILGNRALLESQRIHISKTSSCELKSWDLMAPVLIPGIRGPQLCSGVRIGRKPGGHQTAGNSPRIHEDRDDLEMMGRNAGMYQQESVETWYTKPIKHIHPFAEGGHQ